MGLPTARSLHAAGTALLFNLEVFEEGEPPARGAAVSQEIVTACERLASFTRLPATGWATQLSRDVKAFKRSADGGGDRIDVVLLGAWLSSLGYSVVVRCALGGLAAVPGSGGPGSCFRNLRHEFLFVRCESGEATGLEVLVDPHFRQQFAIPQPTPGFQALLAALPEEFIGSALRLQPVVELVCAEMAASFEARGLTIPPWRRPAAMLSKWLPAKAKDICVDSSSGAPGGASPEHGRSPTKKAPGGSPEARLAEAAQQLAALAMHSQRQASPVEPQVAAAPAPPPTIARLPLSLAMSMPPPPQWSAAGATQELGDPFARLSEPILRPCARLTPRVSLLSAQLANNSSISPSRNSQSGAPPAPSAATQSDPWATLRRAASARPAVAPPSVLPRLLPPPTPHGALAVVGPGGVTHPSAAPTVGGHGGKATGPPAPIVRHHAPAHAGQPVIHTVRLATQAATAVAPSKPTVTAVR